MRSLFFGAAAALALAAPVAANADTPGFVDLSVGQIDIDDEDVTTLNIGGSADVGLQGPWRAQFDVDVGRLSEDDFNITTTNTAAHLYWNGDSFAFGGVLTNQDLYFGSVWSLGAEGQFNAGNFVIEGEAGFGTLEGPGDSENTFNAALDVTFYPMENFSVGAGVALLDIDEFDDELTSTRVEAEYQFNGSQFSIFGNYTNTDVDSFDTDAVRLGLRFNFGDDSLMGRRQNGPHWLRNSQSSPFFGFIS